MNPITTLKVKFAGKPVGLLAWQDRQLWFQYDTSCLQEGFDLSPSTMSFDPSPQLAKQPTFNGLHGAFYDSLPDGWGLLLMDRFFKKTLNRDRHEITTLDRLAYMGNRAMGALTYEPAIDNESINQPIQLSKLAEDAEKLLNGKTNAVLNQLRILGGSPGGARPKVTIALADDNEQCLSGLTDLPPGYQHWLVKFHGQSDPKDMGRIEKAYAEIASLAGIDMPPNRLIQVKHADKHTDHFYAVQRFDRVGNERLHMLTLSGYLYADFRLPSVDYHSLLAATACLTKDIREVEKAFRLMVFNVIMHNKDDHAKNFAFLRSQSGQWQLAPGYDLTFSSGMNNEHTTAINGSGNPDTKDIVAVANMHGITRYQEIMDQVRRAAKCWHEVAEKLSVSKKSTEQVGRAIKQ